uniref:NAD(P)H-binding protein n=1 Tax=Arenibaculum pallidiluteum TaxID=2812559 RepID=UPI002E2DC41F|nr:NAD(P)H-binding protein [Arenibaculum pallidiluteum]
MITRDPSRLDSPGLPAETRGRIDVVQGSHGDADVADRAFVDAVFWLVPPIPGAHSLDAANLDFTRPACEAIRKRGVKRVVAVSAIGRGWPGMPGWSRRRWRWRI